MAVFHSRTVRSSDDVASVWPSELKATALTSPVCPRSVARGRRPGRSQRMHVLSRLAEARVRPSELSARS